MLFLTREIRFSLAPDAGCEQPRESANTWAGWPSSAALAPYLRLRATFLGKPDPVTGYLCDIKFIDDTLQETAIPLAQQLAGAQPAHPTPGQLLRTMWQRFPHERFPGIALVQMQLLPEPYLAYTLHRDNPEMIQFTEQFEFSASHRLHCPGLTDRENLDLFGKCNNPNGHGHNYVVEVTVAAETITGSPRHRLGKVVKERVLDRFDHKHLNEDTTEFRELNPTVENITRVVWELLAAPLKPTQLLSVRVYETPKTWAEYHGGHEAPVSGPV